MGNVGVVIKEDGRKQRADIALTKEVATALLQKVLAGETLYPKERYLMLAVGDKEPERISCRTIEAWVVRNNVIPETGRTLRDVLDEARIEYRRREREKKQTEMVAEAEAAMHRTLRVRTNLPVIGMMGVVKDANGKIVRKENAALLKVKMDTTQFILERLDADKYGKKDKVEGKHLLFSLSDLRKAREGMNEAQNA